MPGPRPFLFDIGNVICTVDFEPVLARLTARGTAGEGRALDLFAEAKDVYESGGASDEEFVAQVIETIGFEGDRAEFASLWTGIFTENEPMAELVEALAGAGHPLYLLSNTNALHVDYLLRAFPAFRHFSGAVYSHEVGAIKPDEQIYRAAFDRYSLRPAETFYIDDLPDNIEAGERLGLASHRYDIADHGALLAWLRGHGVAAAG